MRFNERFRIGAAGEGKLVSDEELAAAMEECERANAGAPITVFEITTAAGDVAVRAQSCGCRLDGGRSRRAARCNECDRHPLATIITRISIDHVDFLGDSLEKIAAEKAGILKRGVPAIIAAQDRDALAVIERQAAKLGAPLKVAGEDWTATEERGRLVYQDEDRPARFTGAKALWPASIRERRIGHRGIAHNQAIQASTRGL